MMDSFSLKCRSLWIVLVWMFFCIYSVAQVPEYYQQIDLSKDGLALKIELQELIIETHTAYVTYTPGVWNALRITDLDPKQQDQVMLIYGFNDEDGVASTDRIRHVDLSCHTSGCVGLWVREHVYPRSLGTPNLGTQFAGADLHALRAIDDQRNNIRGNRVFGPGSGDSFITPRGTYFPGDEWKGDVARMMMYMHLRYPDQCPAIRVGEGNLALVDFDSLPEIFLIWNAEDPPSEYEYIRNDLFEALQGNRNPFIDNPALATRIWGGPVADDYWSSTTTQPNRALNVQIYPTVVSDTIFIKDSLGSMQYFIFDIQGRQIMSGQTESSINVYNLSAGTYILFLSSGDGYGYRKFVRE